jgi:transcriptional regulator with XRE-family HTH domain
MDNIQLRYIIKEIQQKEGVGLAEIAAKAGLDRSYLSSFIHSKVKKLVTEKLLGKLGKAFPIYFNGEQQNTTEPTNHDGTPLSGSITVNDYKAEIEKRIAEIEARRRDAEAMYEDAKEDKKRLLNIIDANLTQLLTNSNKHLAYLEKILLVDRADHETIMDSQDRIEHQPVGSNARRAGMREVEAEKHLRKKGKKSQDGVSK